MQHFEFEHPLIFLLLGLIFCIFKCPYKLKRLFFPHLHFFSKYKSFFHKEKLLYTLIFTLLVTALASPITYDSKLSNHRKGRDLVFALDSSGSMGEQSYSQEMPNASKFEILRSLIRSFVQKRFDDNVGVTVFGSFAFSSVPLTYDMKAVAFLLDFIEVGIAGENTAIGDGLMQALALLEKGSAKSKAIILVTDGYQNSGRTSIKDAVAKAKKMHVKIYTIGLGKSSDFDSKLLKKIALDTDAKMFSAKSAKELQAVYSQLNSLEPSKIHSQNYLNKELFYGYPLAFASLLLLSLLAKRREV